MFQKNNIHCFLVLPCQEGCALLNVRERNLRANFQHHEDFDVENANRRPNHFFCSLCSEDSFDTKSWSSIYTGRGRDNQRFHFGYFKKMALFLA